MSNGKPTENTGAYKRSELFCKLCKKKSRVTTSPVTLELIQEIPIFSVLIMNPEKLMKKMRGLLHYACNPS